MSRVHARLGRIPSMTLLAAALTTVPALAQDVSGLHRFSSVLGNADTLYPQSPTASDAAPQAVPARAGTLDYSANTDVAKVVVEVDRNGVPADGQSAVHVSVQVLGADGLPLAGKAFATVENSGGRIRLPGTRTDELGPGAADADKVVPGVQVPVENGRAEFDLLAPYDPQDVTLRVTAGASRSNS